jgi:hypothetical protein
MEYTRFKEKMQKLLNNNYKKAKIGLQIVNPAPKRHSNDSIIEHGLPIKTGASIAEEEESPVSFYIKLMKIFNSLLKI